MAVTAQNLNRIIASPASNSTSLVHSLYQQFDSKLRGFLINNLRNKADAEDIAQEVYLRFSRLQNVRKIRCERAFLFTTALNLLRDRSRRVSTQLDKASICIDDVTLESSYGNPEEHVLRAEQQKLVSSTLRGLNDNRRQAFLLSRVDGKSYSEIAALMGVSVSMVEKHVSAALANLRENLNHQAD